jgi:hypothetical protein
MAETSDDFPKFFRSGIEKFATAKEEFIEKFFDVLANEPILLKKAHLKDSISSKFSQEEKESIENLIELLLSIVQTTEDYDLPSLNVAKAVTAQIRSTFADEQAFSEDSYVLFERRLHSFLDVDEVLKVVVKSASLIYKEENVFNGMEVITDARPVMNLSGEKVAGLVISHTLRVLLYGDNRKPMYVSFDSSDLDLMIEKLQAAKTKESLLKEMLRQSSIQCASLD